MTGWENLPELDIEVAIERVATPWKSQVLAKWCAKGAG